MTETTPTDIERWRPKLLAVAYRMLGTVADAEDAVQDAFLRYQQHANEVESPEGWLVRTTTRLCIDRLRQVEREKYVGQWLPEPVSEKWPGAEADRIELAESLSMAFLVLLETLSPSERAAYLLREVFSYDYEEIASLLELRSDNVRQLASRAKRKIEKKEKRFEPDATHADTLAERFFAACQVGDVQSLENLLAQDVVLYSDGGGKVFASPKPIQGIRKVANLLEVVFRKLRQLGATCQVSTVNGRPGIVVTLQGKPVEIISCDVGEASIDTLYIILNPDKLNHWPSESSAESSGENKPGLWEKKRATAHQPSENRD